MFLELHVALIYISYVTPIYYQLLKLSDEGCHFNLIWESLGMVRRMGIVIRKHALVKQIRVCCGVVKRRGAVSKYWGLKLISTSFFCGAIWTSR